MAVGLSEEFYATRLVEFFKEVENFGRVVFEEFESGTADADCALKETTVSLSDFDQSLKSGDVALFCGLSDGALVLVIIIVIMIGTDIKETIALEMDILVNLEVQTNCLHNIRVFMFLFYVYN